MVEELGFVLLLCHEQNVLLFTLILIIVGIFGLFVFVFFFLGGEGGVCLFLF